MTEVKLSDLEILDVGNSIQLAGAIYSGNGKTYLIPLPDEDPSDLFGIGKLQVLAMTDSEMERFLNQTDVLDVKAGKAILRKTQRQIDQTLSWKVFRRDGYACRYCGKDSVPLTVDHVDTWEDGGATIEDNLVTACRRCNKTRGNRTIVEWLSSGDYIAAARNLTVHQAAANAKLALDWPRLQTLRIKKRSR